MSTLTVRKFRSAEGAESRETSPKSLQEEGVTPGTSALFLLTTNEVPDRTGDALPDGGAEPLHSNLYARNEERPREAFGDVAA
ncbi:hypothetical protein [Streptomyces sp. NBC_01363]|uniref:hypothetical protein n=1 Tax=Streptomyces sp. NBC_01363 TaxID=2903840 RepID=UPI00225A4C41|nr:hypothetical protein [Streptomyces sp. NBC_01363]MCX4734090.1 DUF1269 domain-containing protein [Streptomyces sp. NBC_01363]